MHRGSGCKGVEAARETTERARQRWRNGFLSGWSDCWRDIEEVTDLDAGKRTRSKGRSEEDAVEKIENRPEKSNKAGGKRSWVGSEILVGSGSHQVRVACGTVESAHGTY